MFFDVIVISGESQAVFCFYIGFDVPIELVFPCMILLVLFLSNLLHFFIVVEVQLVVCRFLLPEVDSKIFSQMIFLDSLYYFFLFVQLFLAL